MIILRNKLYTAETSGKGSFDISSNKHYEDALMSALEFNNKASLELLKLNQK